MKTVHTRNDYMDGKVTHREYYGQFVTPHILATVSRIIGKARILASKDEHFNDIPLARWDAIIGFMNLPKGPRILHDLNTSAALKQAGDDVSAACLVCIMKEAAQQIRETKGK